MTDKNSAKHFLRAAQESLAQATEVRNRAVEHRREVVRAAHRSGWSVAELAEALGLSRSAVVKVLHTED